MASSKSQFQSLGGGAYRVTGARVSPTTGRYLTASGGSGRSTTKANESVRSSTSDSKATGGK